MSDEQIFALLNEAFAYASPAQAARERPPFRMDANLSDLGIESVCAMEMAGFIEERHGVAFPDDDMASISNVADFARLIRQHVLIAAE